MSKSSGSNSNNYFSIADEYSADQLVLLEKLEQLSGLDPEITELLARALDRLQKTRPYQPISRYSQNNGEPLKKEGSLPLNEAEKAIRTQYVTQELTSLLAVAGQLSQSFFKESSRNAKPDRHFKDNLRAQLFTDHSVQSSQNLF